MRLERWQEIVEQIKNSFDVEDSGIIEDDENGGTKTEYIEFNGPLGHLRLEYSTHPLILQTNTKYHKRIGSETSIDYVYSPTETTSSLDVFRWDDELNDWRVFDSKAFS
ncbi:MAG: hypothetical protein NTY12_00635 [Candidatus Falkowbacteria bacterium]|nr:hypothetical protein [Candidatus Falkowbacteria bacterium]